MAINVPVTMFEYCRERAATSQVLTSTMDHLVPGSTTFNSRGRYQTQDLSLQCCNPPLGHCNPPKNMSMRFPLTHFIPKILVFYYGQKIWPISKFLYVLNLENLSYTTGHFCAVNLVYHILLK